MKLDVICRLKNDNVQSYAQTHAKYIPIYIVTILYVYFFIKYIFLDKALILFLLMTNSKGSFMFNICRYILRKIDELRLISECN